MTSILCIDDEEPIRSLIVEELEEAGFTTFQAANGREGLEIILAKWPDIIICDITMPEMDGQQLLAELQLNHPELANTPFIFLTALGDKEIKLEGLRAGAEDYLIKPVDFDLLLAKIDGCILRLENNRKVGGTF